MDYESKTVPPDCEEVEGVEQFEGMIKREGEFTARLKNVARSTSNLPCVKDDYVIVMGVKIPRDRRKMITTKESKEST